MSAITSNAPQSRGPADHNVREQIVEAAGEHFSRYGYEKTTVSDLAKAIGFSKAYIYKFFDSKQAIGEAICSKSLSAIVAAVEEAVIRRFSTAYASPTVFPSYSAALFAIAPGVSTALVGVEGSAFSALRKLRRN